MLGILKRKKTALAAVVTEEAPASVAPRTFTVYVTVKSYQVLIDFVLPGQVEGFQYGAERGLARIEDSSIRPTYFLYAERLGPKLYGLRIDIDRLEGRHHDHEMSWLLGPSLWQICLERVEQAKREPRPESGYKAEPVELAESDWLRIESSCQQLWREWRERTAYRVTLYSRTPDGRTREEKTHGGLSSLDSTEVWKRSFQKEAQQTTERERHQVERYGSDLYPELPREHWVEVE